MKYAISFDIDGVINNYPQCFLDFCQYSYGFAAANLVDLKNTIDENEYLKIKNEYRNSDYKYNLPVDLNIASAIKKLSFEYDIYILTSRPFYKFPAMFDRTSLWLKKNGIAYKEMLPKSSDSINNKRIRLHVDDEEDHILPLLNQTSANFILLKKMLISNLYNERIYHCSEKNIIYNVIKSVVNAV
jgi:hypothetical protein